MMQAARLHEVMVRRRNGGNGKVHEAIIMDRQSAKALKRKAEEEMAGVM